MLPDRGLHLPHCSFERRARGSGAHQHKLLGGTFSQARGGRAIRSSRPCPRGSSSLSLCERFLLDERSRGDRRRCRARASSDSWARCGFVADEYVTAIPLCNLAGQHSRGTGRVGARLALGLQPHPDLVATLCLDYLRMAAQCLCSQECCNLGDRQIAPLQRLHACC